MAVEKEDSYFAVACASISFDLHAVLACSIFIDTVDGLAGAWLAVVIILQNEDLAKDQMIKEEELTTLGSEPPVGLISGQRSALGTIEGF